MRITGGLLRGRKIKTRRNSSTRPLLSRLRKSLFDIIGDEIREASFLDLYAGSGAVGIEALSRGAKRVVFVEKKILSVKIIKENLASCRLFSQSRIWCKDVLTFLSFLLKREEFDFIFIAPPYYRGMQDKTLDIVEAVNIEKTEIIVQHSPNENVNFTRKNMKIIKQRKYGDTILTFLRRADESH